MSNQSTKRATLYLAIVFVAGTAFGFAASRFFAEPTAEAGVTAASEYRRNLLETLDQRLELTEEQLTEVIVIFEDMDVRFREIRDAMEPEFEAIRADRAERVMGVLTSNQQGEYQLILDERQRRREERASRHSEARR